MLAILIVTMGCAHTAPPFAAVAASGGETPAAAAWRVPATDFPTQRLFRLHYDGPEGEGRLRLTLRLWTPRRYQLAVADALGRSLWTLHVEEGRTLLLDHRREIFCPPEGEGSDVVPDLGFGPLAPEALPAVLLGRLPATPAGGGVEIGGESGEVEFHDASGRRWTATLRGGAPATWTLWRGRKPEVLWLAREGWGVLSDRRRGAQLRWRESVREPLAGAEPTPPAVPDGYRPGDCRAPPRWTGD